MERRDEFIISQAILCVSECNEIKWSSNSDLRFIISNLLFIALTAHPQTLKYNNLFQGEKLADRQKKQTEKERERDGGEKERGRELNATPN